MRLHSAYVLILAMLFASAADAKDEFWLGAGVSSDAAYLGAPSIKTSIVPMWDFRRAVSGATSSDYFARISRGYPEIGVQTLLSSNVRVGVQMGVESGRQLKDFSDRARMMGITPFGDGLGMGVHLEASGNWGAAPMAAVVRFRQRTPAPHGMLVDIRYDVGVYTKGAFGLGLNAQSIWANANAMQTDFGVTAQQAASMGRNAFDAKNGWQSMALGASAQYDLSPSTQWIASVKRVQLGWGAADSPIAERRQSTGLAMGIIWKF